MKNYRLLLIVILVVAAVSLYHFSWVNYKSYSDERRQARVIPYPTIDATTTLPRDQQAPDVAPGSSAATFPTFPTRVALPAKPTATPHPHDFNDFTNASWLQQHDPRLYGIASNLKWVSDGITEVESEPIQALVDLSIEDPVMAEMFIEAPCFADALSEDEAWAFTSVVYLAFEAPDTAARLVSIPWFADGIDEDEFWAVSSVADIAYESRSAAEQLVSKTWFTDGISRDESWAISALATISFETGSASKFVTMPFLDSVEPSDSAALVSLGALINKSPEAFNRLLSHPEVANGITDEETVLLTLASDVYETDPGLADKLLDSSEFLTETRDIELPLTGEARLVIVRTQPGSPRSMGFLEDAVRFTESYMDEALPRSLVILLYADAVHLGFDGHNSGTNMIVRPDYDMDGGRVDDLYDGMILTHEVAHYYWHSSAESWLDEGAAEMISVAHAASNIGIDVTEIFDTGLAGLFYCPDADNLFELDKLPFQQAEECAYSLGPLFFLDLCCCVASSPTLPTEGLGLIFQPLRNDRFCGDAELEGISDVSAVTSFWAVGV